MSPAIFYPNLPQKRQRNWKINTIKQNELQFATLTLIFQTFITVPTRGAGSLIGIRVEFVPRYLLSDSPLLIGCGSCLCSWRLVHLVNIQHNYICIIKKNENKKFCYFHKVGLFSVLLLKTNLTSPDNKFWQRNKGNPCSCFISSINAPANWKCLRKEFGSSRLAFLRFLKLFNVQLKVKFKSSLPSKSDQGDQSWGLNVSDGSPEAKFLRCFDIILGHGASCSKVLIIKSILKALASKK